MRPQRRTSAGARFFWALCITTALATPSFAAAPTTSVFEGYLRTAGGGAAPNGDYKVTFRLYDNEKSQTPYWVEGPVTVKVSGGQFSHVLGSSKPLNAKVFGAKASNWLELQVGADPAIARQRLHAAAYALTAADVSCTGCVSVSEISFDGDVSLGAHALTAGKIVAKDIAASTVTAQKFVGDGSGLTGIKSTGTGIKPKTCSGGKFVVGVNSNGELICGSNAGGLPKDGLKTVSNGTLSNNFTDVITSKNTPVKIPDNAPPGVKDTITVPDLGTAEAFSVSLDINSSSIEQLEVYLIDPNDDKYTLFFKGLKGPALVVSYPPAKPISGNLSKWVGKNLKGKWTLKVVDTVFLNNNTDGQINKWSINISTLSNKKVQVNGDLVVTGKISAAGGGATTFPTDTAKCDASKKGQVRYAHSRGAEICNGMAWVAMLTKPIVYEGHCSHTRYYASSWSYYCLNRTYINTAQDYLTISTKAPATGTSSSSTYRNQWQNDSQIGRITAKIAGYYRLTFRVRARHSHSWWYGALLRNGSTVMQADEYEYSGTHYDTHELEKIVWLNVGQYINARARTSSNSTSYWAWHGCGNTLCPYGGFRVEYLGHDWK